jgi:hypothetical protein
MHLVYGVDKGNDLSMGSITVVENKVEQANLPDMFKCTTYVVGMKTVRIFSDRIRDRIRLEGF